MKIISNFTDYYDQMLQYGVDKHITFSRINSNNFKATNPNDWQMNFIQSEKNSPRVQKILEMHIPNSNGELSENDRNILSAYNSNSFKLMGSVRPFEVEEVQAVINGKVFTSYMLLESVELRNPGSSAFGVPYRIFKKNASMRELFDHIKENKQYFNFNLSYNQGVKDILDCNSYDEYAEKKYKSSNFTFKSRFQAAIATEKDLMEIHKEIGSPIYFLRGSRLYKDIPLSYFGLFNVFDGNMEKTYQEIAYCLANVISNKNEPPVAISDTDKIQQHGFDKKKSFRHR